MMTPFLARSLCLHTTEIIFGFKLSAKINCKKAKGLICVSKSYTTFTSLVHKSLRKHAYANLLKILQPNKDNFQIKNSDIFFYIPAKTIDCGYSLEPPLPGGSNEYPQSLFLSRIKENNAYPCKPQFYCIKVGLKGGQIYIGKFS